MLSHQIIQSPDIFQDLRERWNALNADCAFPSLFMAWEWQFSWWEAFGGNLFIILIQENDKDVAILPFVADEKPLFTQLNPIGSPHSDYLDFLIRIGNEERVGDYFFKSFLTENKRIGIVTFDAINERSPLTRYLEGGNPDGFWRAFQKKSVCPYLPLPQSFDTCLENLTPKTRYFIQRKTRKVEKDFKVTVGVVRERSELKERLEQFIEQHQTLWANRGRPGAFFDEAVRTFHRIVSQRLLNTGHLKLFYLDLDGKPAASYYLFLHERDLLFYLTGFDPAFARYSPGSVLLTRIIQDAIENKYREFDFMRGTAPYKFKWSDQTRTNQSFWLIRKRLTTLSYLMGQWIVRDMAAFIKRKLSLRTKRVIRNALPGWVIRTFDKFFRE
ncbi:hypothetical protein UR09_02975 [Candidatus Nitromaritima sp. SCGC AAA799-A02]|nr:hypothetical protein UR09_02975 [Candidatus Nitromaritima sp. SCGC AAA799-A02]